MPQSVAVLLAAGQGKRMRSDLPKVLHRLAGRPMINHVVAAARAAEVSRIVVVVGHGAEQVEAALPEGVETVRQPELLGTADAVGRARDLLAAGAVEDVVVAHGDCPLLTSELFRELIDRRRRTDATITLVVSTADDPRGYGRVRRDPAGQVEAVVEEASASPAERAIAEINAGVYCFEARWLWPQLALVRPSPSGEYYLTDLIELAIRQGKIVQSIEAPLEVTQGVNDRVQLAAAEQVMRQRVRRELMLSGVTLLDPATTYVDVGVTIGRDTTIYPGSLIEGTTAIGNRCQIGPYSRIVDSRLGDEVTVLMSVVEGSELADRSRMGPFSHLRPGARLGEDVELGNYGEVKNASLGAGTKMHHFSYVGDAEVGVNVNLGAGMITCNFDSESGEKSRTVIEDNASIGSDTMLIAPVRVGAGAYTGAGAVVTRDVQAGDVVIGMPAKPLRQRRDPSA